MTQAGIDKGDLAAQQAETERKYNCYFSLFISRLLNAAQYGSVRVWYLDA